MKKMNIALISPASLPATQFGGILFLAVDIARELSRKGNKITIYTTDLDFTINSRSFNKKLPRNEKIKEFTIKRSHVWLSIKLFFINPGIYFQLKHDNNDIIHCIGIRSFQSLIGAIIAKNKKIPLVISDQGGLTTHPQINSSYFNKILYKLQNPLIKFIIKNASKIIVANEYEKKIFEKYSDSEKISIVRNGINLEDFVNFNNDFRIKYSIQKKFFLFVGRFNHVKGIDILIKAINEIKNELIEKDWLCVIMGVDFGYQDQMLKLIEKYNLEKIIRIIKKPIRSDVISAYEKSEFLVLPSRWELSPLTPLEGFAFRKPVISTNCHGIPYTIENNKNCILTKPEDFKDVSNAIMYFIDNEVDRLKFGENGFEWVKNKCNSIKMVEEVEKIYQELLK